MFGFKRKPKKVYPKYKIEKLTYRDGTEKFRVLVYLTEYNFNTGPEALYNYLGGPDHTFDSYGEAEVHIRRHYASHIVATKTVAKFDVDANDIKVLIRDNVE